MRMRRGLVVAAGAALALALLAPSAALAKGPGSGGGGGGRPGEEASNSLSVPAVFVGTNPYGLPCDSAGTLLPSSVLPTGDPLTDYEVPGYYYVQGVHSWRASCLQGFTAATAQAAWGDNLTGDASMKVGSPIRVEIGLLADEATMGLPALTGWDVVKLQTSLADRLSAYGTLATEVEPDVFTSTPVTPYPETRVWAAGTQLTITGPGFSVNEPASAEINATGRVVYGYNLRVPTAGDYTITYTFPGVDVTGTDGGTVGDMATGDSVTLTITVGSGGGGGGGGGNRPW